MSSHTGSHPSSSDSCPGGASSGKGGGTSSEGKGGGTSSVGRGDEASLSEEGELDGPFDLCSEGSWI